VGPTAVGKTALAEALAVALDGEIVSADSMQVYRGMDVGTAKPPAGDRRVPYHCIDVVDPGEPFSAALYQKIARDAIACIAGAARVPVVVGGTGLYVRAVLDPFEFPEGEQRANAVRERYEAVAERQGPDRVYALLQSADPASAALIHPNNTRRVIRALEMHEAGVSYAAHSERFSVRESIYDARFIGLTMERPHLYERIDARVDAMMSLGLPGEVERLLHLGFREALTAQQAIGYKELVPVVEQGADLSEAVLAIKQATRRYAKRQFTWFKADSRVRWLDVTELSLEDALTQALRALDW
jgi:tRNA dimethylallyltransferase